MDLTVLACVYPCLNVPEDTEWGRNKCMPLTVRKYSSVQAGVQECVNVSEHVCVSVCLCGWPWLCRSV